MSVATNLIDNWIIDTDFSRHEVYTKDKEILLSSILTMIDINKELNETELEVTDFNFEQNDMIGGIPNLISNKYPIYKNYISKSQNWIGYVLDINEESFFAKLDDKNNPTTYETAYFEIAEVSKDDFELLKKGAIFYWSVGYANLNGQISKQSFIRFKRSVKITEDEFEEIASKVDDIYNELDWD